MAVLFVTRHSGARQWAIESDIAVDQWLDHLDLDQVFPGDRVLGSLPVHLAAKVCERGASYWHLSVDTPFHSRGSELSDADLRRFGARLERFDVHRLNDEVSR